MTGYSHISQWPIKTAYDPSVVRKQSASNTSQALKCMIGLPGNLRIVMDSASLSILALTSQLYLQDTKPRCSVQC